MRKLRIIIPIGTFFIIVVGFLVQGLTVSTAIHSDVPLAIPVDYGYKTRPAIRIAASGHCGVIEETNTLKPPSPQASVKPDLNRKKEGSEEKRYSYRGHINEGFERRYFIWDYTAGRLRMLRLNIPDEETRLILQSRMGELILFDSVNNQLYPLYNMPNLVSGSGYSHVEMKPVNSTH